MVMLSACVQAVGLWANPNGEVRVFSACDEGTRDIYENVEIATYRRTSRWLMSIAMSMRTSKVLYLDSDIAKHIALAPVPRTMQAEQRRRIVNETENETENKCFRVDSRRVSVSIPDVFPCRSCSASSRTSTANALSESAVRVQLKEASNEEWTFVSIVRRNRVVSDDGTPLLRDTTTMTNFGKTREGSDLEECFYDSDAMFSFLEINYPVLLSPIMMTARAVPVAELQQEYYRMAHDLHVRMGPAQRVSSSNQDGDDDDDGDENGGRAPIAVEKRDFVHTSVIMAPPILFVTRNKPSARCPFQYSTEFARLQHDRMRNLKCAAPYACSPDLCPRSPRFSTANPHPPKPTTPHPQTLNADGNKFGKPEGLAGKSVLETRSCGMLSWVCWRGTGLVDGSELLLSCDGAAEDEANVFGLEPVTLSYQTGYADFL
eukprot:3160641-Rhodomonas_salina.1